MAVIGCARSGEPRIYQIQGAGMVSPWRGRLLRRVPGVVTLVTEHGFFMQDPEGDGDPATSDGIFVYTRRAPSVRRGEALAVSGRVREYRPGGRHSNNLSVTEIHPARITRTANTFHPASVQPRVLGAGGLMPPTDVIASAAWHSSGVAIDGLHFYQRLQGMLVEVHAPQALAPVNRYGDVWVVPSRGRGATGMNEQGGITVRSLAGGTDFNPERLLLDTPGQAPAAIGMGRVLHSVRGVMDYDYGNYRLRLLHRLRVAASQEPARSDLTSAHRDSAPLSIASYNLDNLDPNDDDGDRDVATGRFRRIAQQIVHALGAPEIVALQEIQDDDGARDSRVTSAEATLRRLCFEVRAVGGPRYHWVQVDPRHDRDGGQPGGNIRPVLLYDPQRVKLRPRSAHAKGRSAKLIDTSRGPGVSPNPARIEPTARVFRHSRKPLAASFEIAGRRWLIVDNHFTSRRSSSSLYGRRQPPLVGGARRRRAQAEALRRFLAPLASHGQHYRVIVLGDFNDFAFSHALAPLVRKPPLGLGLVDAAGKLPPAARFSYVYQGNSQALDHVFVPPALAGRAHVRIVHVNTTVADGASDHDPVLVSIEAAQ